MASGTRKGEEGSRVVSFRVDASYAERLDGIAKKDRTSPGSVARRALFAYLENDDGREIGQAVQDIKAAQKRSDEAVAKASKLMERVERAIADDARRLSDSVQMLLVSAGKLTPDQAREFARRHLLDDGGKKP